METFYEKRARRGNSVPDIALFVIVAGVLAFMGFAIFKFVDQPKPMLRKVYTSWTKDQPGFKQVMREQQDSHLPVLVYFYADWCPHCKELNAKVISDTSVDQYLHRMPHVRIAPDDGTAEKRLMERFGAQGYPSLYIVMPDGHSKVIETFVMKGVPRQKTPAEFIATIDELTNPK